MKSNRTVTKSVRFTEQEAERLEASAKQGNLTVSAYIKQSLESQPLIVHDHSAEICSGICRIYTLMGNAMQNQEEIYKELNAICQTLS